MGLFSVSKSSTTLQTQQTNNYDQRQQNDASGGGVLGNGNTSDSFNRFSTTNIGTDPGVSSINATNAALLQALSGQQGDTMGVIAGLSAQGLRANVDSATNLFDTAASNSATAWGHTVDASTETLDKMFSAAQGVLGASTSLAQAAMTTYQPADNKASDNTTKVVAYVAAAAVAAFLLTRKG